MHGEKIIFYTEWINMQKLAILGIQKEHAYIVLFMLGIFIVYILLQPIIQWLLHKNSYKLLTYVISSLSLLVILLFAAYMKGGGVEFSQLIRYALLTLTIFGLALFIINIVHFLLQKWIKKSV